MRAFVAEKTDDGVTRGLREDFELDGDGDVVVDVAYSSVNYKDALATIAKGQVARISPLVPGIDLAGTTSSGEPVLAHGYDLGVSHHGGYAEQARVKSEWVVPLPDGLSARQAMAIGTAGYTAARCVMALEAAGLTAGAGPVLVTGASGGVGSTAVDILAARGYEVVASSGSSDPAWLRELGASEVISREDAAGDAGRPLEKSRWAGAVDCVGGAVLAGVVRGLMYGGAVAACGNTGGIKLEATVLPFILRGVSLLGVDSVQTPIEERRETWARLATDLRPPHLDGAITREIALDEVEGALDAVLRGELQGRTIVRVAG
jgi:acrylyl-CoA reductase (NADPH)